MKKYYTRACNFFYQNNQKDFTSSSRMFLNGDRNISFDSVEILSRNSKKKIKLKNINSLNKSLKKKIKSDLQNITKKKKFKNLNLSNSPLIMGILNITPDSFSDGGKYYKSGNAYKHAINLKNQGSDIIDVGAESTRPGAKDLNPLTEWKRLKSPLSKIYKKFKFISLDSRKLHVMEKAYNFNIKLINDVSGLAYDNGTIKFLKKTRIPFVIHHTIGTPKTMQNNPKYKNVLLDIYDYFEDKIKKIRTAGIKHNNIILDPGIGFGKNLKHNITLLKNISIFHSLGFPLLLGISRKKFIKEIAMENDSAQKYGGTISTSLFLMNQGVQILRVHDVNEIKQAIKTFKKLTF